MNILWLDDLRDPFSDTWSSYIEKMAGWGQVYWVKSYYDFKTISVDNMIPREIDAPFLDEYGAIFFDNDLGPGKEGRHAFNLFEDEARRYGFERTKLFAQTSNPAARKELLLGFKSLQKFWDESDEVEEFCKKYMAGYKHGHGYYDGDVLISNQMNASNYLCFVTCRDTYRTFPHNLQCTFEQLIDKASPELKKAISFHMHLFKYDCMVWPD